ncbi:MAG: phosphoadenosine phosphosulfate reductase family protein [Myxococcales bacterium]|nr:phosphoadenosine phosphosulfate reductase family protein [Myxococcales bacterium]
MSAVVAIAAPPLLTLPHELQDHELVTSISGGKDSTALILALREADIPTRYVFADTGWEAPEVYAYLDLLRDRLGIRIDVVGAEGGMIARARHRAGFPCRTGRWCTRELELEPIRAYHAELEEDLGRPSASIVGVRAQESRRRAAMPELEQEAMGPRSWGWWVWRPLIGWSVEDVLRIHARHGVPVNPLYQAGADRVGCWPCIFSNKDELRLIAQRDPARIEQIAALEEELTELRQARNAEAPGRYTTPRTSFFQGRQSGPLGVAPSIHDVVAWARTSRGGRQLPLFEAGPRGGCLRWGLCEAAEPAEEG